MEPSVTMTEADSKITITFTVHQRPWTTNAERKGNRWVRASQTSEWRTLFGWLSRSQRFPLLTGAICVVWLEMKGSLQDVAACNPAIKAAIDGMVDGGLLLDDTPEHLKAIMFHAPTRAKTDKLTIKLIGEVNG